MKKIIVICILLFPFSSGAKDELTALEIRCDRLNRLIFVTEEKLAESNTDISANYFMGKISTIMNARLNIGCDKPKNK